MNDRLSRHRVTDTNLLKTLGALSVVVYTIQGLTNGALFTIANTTSSSHLFPSSTATLMPSTTALP